MKISTRGRYSLRVMIELARRLDEGFIPLKQLSKDQNISKKYMEQILPPLVKNGLLTASRGHLGGYQLAQAPAKITIKDIIISAEGSLAPVACMDHNPNECENCETCLTLPIYQGLYQTVSSYLESITLQDVLDGKAKTTI